MQKDSRRTDASIAEHVYGWRWVSGYGGKRLLSPPAGDPRCSWTAAYDDDGIPHWLPRFSEGEL